MLYPRENKSQRILLYSCRNCNYSQSAPNTSTGYCIYINDLKQQPTAGTTISRELILDPTLRRTKQISCPLCHYNEAVYFNSSELKLDLIFVCCNPDCTHHWYENQQK